MDEVGRLRFALDELAGMIHEHEGLDGLAELHLELDAMNATLALLRRDVATRLGDAMDARRVELDGIGGLERHRRSTRRNWDREDLVRAVFDSRLVNEATGELADETATDKLRHVFNLGAPRVAALRARGIEPDEFCEVDPEPGWTIRVLNAEPYWQRRNPEHVSEED